MKKYPGWWMIWMVIAALIWLGCVDPLEPSCRVIQQDSVPVWSAADGSRAPIDVEFTVTVCEPGAFPHAAR